MSTHTTKKQATYSLLSHLIGISRHTISDRIAKHFPDICFQEDKFVLFAQSRRKINWYQLSLFDAIKDHHTTYAILSHDFRDCDCGIILNRWHLSFIDQSTPCFYETVYPIFFTIQRLFKSINCFNDTNRRRKVIALQSFYPLAFLRSIPIGCKMFLEASMQIIGNAYISNFSANGMTQLINKVHALSLRNMTILCQIIQRYLKNFREAFHRFASRHTPIFLDINDGIDVNFGPDSQLSFRQKTALTPVLKSRLFHDDYCSYADLISFLNDRILFRYFQDILAISSQCIDNITVSSV